jgi:hypothetical protein
MLALERAHYLDLTHEHNYGESVNEPSITWHLGDLLSREAVTPYRRDSGPHKTTSRTTTKQLGGGLPLSDLTGRPVPVSDIVCFQQTP